MYDRMQKRNNNNCERKKFQPRKKLTSLTFSPARFVYNNLEMIMILLILAAVFANKVQESVFMPANGQLLWTTG